MFHNSKNTLKPSALYTSGLKLSELNDGNIKWNSNFRKQFGSFLNVNIYLSYDLVTPPQNSPKRNNKCWEKKHFSSTNLSSVIGEPVNLTDNRQI